MTPNWIRTLLERRGVAYQECHHPEAFTAQEVAHLEHTSGHRVAKVVVVMADGRPVELILPASRRVALERVREILGVRDVRLATEEEMNQTFPGCDPGAIPPLNCWPGVDVVMDDTLEVKGEILMQAGTHEDAVRVRFDDWFRMVEPVVDHFTEPVAV